MQMATGDCASVGQSRERFMTKQLLKQGLLLPLAARKCLADQLESFDSEPASLEGLVGLCQGCGFNLPWARAGHHLRPENCVQFSGTRPGWQKTDQQCRGQNAGRVPS